MRFILLIAGAVIVLAPVECVRGQRVQDVELGVTTAAQLRARRGPPRPVRYTHDRTHQLYEYGEYIFYANAKTGVIDFVRWFPARLTTREEAEAVYGRPQSTEAALDLTQTAIYSDTLLASYGGDYLRYTELTTRPQYRGISAENLRAAILLGSFRRCANGLRPDVSIVDSVAEGALPANAGLWAFDSLRSRLSPYREFFQRGDSATICRVTMAQFLTPAKPTKPTGRRGKP